MGFEHVPGVSFEHVPEDELQIRLQVARHQAQIARENREDAADAFRWVFETNYGEVEELYRVGGPLVYAGHLHPMTEREREYLREVKVPVVVPRNAEREHQIFLEFKDAAEAYMRLLESAARRSPDDADEFLIELARALTTLCGVAYRLPNIWDDDWKFPGERSFKESMEAMQNFGVIGPLAQLLEGRHDYVTVVAFGRDAPKDDAEAELLGGTLVDDLSSIYEDVEEGLHMLAAGSSEGEVIYRWHWDFWNHSGTHAVDALRIIHAQVAQSQGGGSIIGDPS
jgi:hypothetical protein